MRSGVVEGFVVVCAWCRKYMSGDPGGNRVSHGICPPCAEAVLRESAMLTGQQAQALGARKSAGGVGDEWSRLWVDEGGEG